MIILLTVEEERIVGFRASNEPLHPVKLNPCKVRDT